MKKDLQIKYGEGIDNEAIYRCTGNKRSFCLTGSPLGNWTRNNEEYLRLTDHGNGLTVQFSDSSESLELNYMQAELLRLALKVNSPEAALNEIEIRKFEKL